MSIDRQPTLLDSLRACGLLTAGPLEELAALPESKDPDPRALARVLLQRKLLSRFQINLVAQGKGKDLRVGPYLLLDKLGEGGMGLVYKARHQHMSRVVALKVIRKEKLANADAVRRFYQEVEAAATLHHPNIVLAFDAGQAGNTHYFAMEFIEGIDLAQQVKQHGPLPESVACDYVRQAALGLQHAFDKGMVHRDIKPHNLLVTTSGPTAVVKILDMGLARMQGQGDSTGVTQSGQVLGTPDYLAPEQAVNSRAADIRSDLYSLGCTLYFLLAGRPPFSGESLAQVLLKHQMEEAPALETLRPDLSAALPNIVRKMMAKMPDQRYQQPSEVVAALEPFARGEGAAIRIPVLPPMIAKDDTSETWATLGGDDDASISTKLRRKSRDATQIGPGESGLLRKAGRKKDKKEKKKSKIGLYSLIGGGLAVPVIGLVLALTLSSGKKDKTRPGADKGKANPVTQVKPKPVEPAPPFVGVLEGKSLGFGGLAISLDGKLGAFPTPERAIGLYDMQTGKQMHLFPNLPAYPSSLAFSEDGKRLVAAAGDRLYEYDLKSHRPIGDPNRPGRFLTRDARMAFTIEGQNAPFTAVVRDVATGNERGRFPAADNTNLQVTFSANNRRTAMVGILKTIQVADLQRSMDLRRVPWNKRTVHPTAVCPTGNDRHLLVGFSDGSVRLIDQITARQLRVFRGVRGGKIWSLALSPDGGQVLTAGDDNLLRLWDVARGEEVGRFEGHNGVVRDVVYTPDGLRAVSCSHNQTLRVWDIDKPTSRPTSDELNRPPPVETPQPVIPLASEIRKFPGHIGGVLSVAFTPDESHALALDYDGVIQWDVSTGQQIRRFSFPRGGEVKMALSADGLQLLTGGGGKLQLWDVKTGKEEKQFIGHESVVSAVALAPNGRLAASGGGASRMEGNQVVYTDSSVRLWDISTGKELHRFGGHTMKVVQVAFSPDGKWLFSSSFDGTWRIWDVEKRVEARAAMQRPGYPPEFRFLPDNRTVLVFPYQNQKLVLWDLKDRKVLHDLIGHTSIMTAALSKDGRLAVSASGGMKGAPGQQPELFDCTVRLWDTSTGKGLGKFATPSINRSVALSPDGTSVLIGDHLGVLRLYDLKKALSKDMELPTPTPTPTPTPMPEKAARFQGHVGAVNSLAVSPNGKYLLTGGEDKTVRLWDYGSGKELKQFGRFINSILSVSFSASGRRAFACDIKTRAISWNVETGEKSWHHGFQYPGTNGAFPLADASGFVRSVGDRIQMHLPQATGSWSGVSSPILIGPLVATGVPEGRGVAVGDARGIVGLFDGIRLKPLLPKMLYQHKGSVLALAFNPRGDRLVSAGDDKLIVIRSVRTGKTLLKIPAHASNIYCLAYSADGKMIVSGSKDRTIRVWSASDGKQIKAFTDLKEPARQVAFDADGKNVLSCGGELQVWPLAVTAPEKFVP